MKKTIGNQQFKFLLGPWMVIPLSLIVAFLVGVVLYEIPEVHRDYERYIFLQGNIDMGGGCLFAGTIGLYIFFGFTAAWYLVLKLEESQTDISYLQTLTNAFLILWFHILVFIAGGTMHFSYDAIVTPNDFRNMFLLAGLLYMLSIIFICILHKLRINKSWKLILAPFFIVLWITIGSDGNTARAGQLVSSEQDPHYQIRGKRHAIMMSWHRVCDSILEN